MIRKFAYGLIGVFLLFYGCSSAVEPVTGFDSSIAVRNWNGVFIETTQDIYEQGNSSVTLELKNESEFFLYYGIRWQLERYDTNGNISLCQYESQPFFAQSMQAISPNHSTKHTIDLSCYGKSLKAGHYRIVFGPIGALTTDIERFGNDDLPYESFLLYVDIEIKGLH